MSSVVVTGSSGYLGAHLVTALAAAGHTVAGWTRREHNLRQPQQVASLSGVDALVLCAWDFSVRSLEDERRVNVAGSTALIRAAQAAGVVRIILISSLSAFPGTPSWYGTAKVELEAVVLAAGGVVLRPGLIWGDPPGGLVARLTRVVARAPIVPVVGAQQPLWTCHVDDLAAMVLFQVDNPSPPAEPVPCAHPEPLTFQQVLQVLAAQQGADPLWLPVPLWAVVAALRTAEGMGLRLGLRSDGLRGLFARSPALRFDLAQAGAPGFRPLARELRETAH